MLARYMTGALAARTGDEMSGPALLVTGLAVTGSPLLASWLLAGLTVSAAAGGPVLGVLLDRARRPGRLLAACLLGYAAGLLLLLGLLVPGGQVRAPDAVLVGLAVVSGLLGPALTGGWTAQLPLVAGPARLGRATALDSMSYNAAGLAGPAVVGVLAAASGGPATVLACAGLLLAALPAAWRLPARGPGPGGGRGGGPGERPGGGRGIRAEMGAGFAAIVRNGALRRATLGSMVSCCGLAMLVVSAPVLGARLTGESGHGTLLLAVTAACGLAALPRGRGPDAAPATTPPERRWDVVLVAGTAVLGAGMVLAAVSTAFWTAVVAAAVAGLGEGPQLTALFAVRHREAPARLRSQVFTTGASLKITSYAIGAALAGPLAAYSVGAALLAGAALQALALAVLLSRRPAPDAPRRSVADGGGGA
ncbi:MFS transporter [Nonomuraea sp. KM90]|uniref:MFS transporter n=1 Tax=Nonomuraea sp. KM90 TaxID=3457428 RepID=UPI003FCD3937